MEKQKLSQEVRHIGLAVAIMTVLLLTLFTGTGFRNHSITYLFIFAATYLITVAIAKKIKKN